MRRRIWVLTVTALALAAAGCGGDGEDRPRPDGGGGFSVASSLAQLPTLDDPDFLSVSVADVAAVREANDLDVPVLADLRAVGDYAMRMTGADPQARAMLVPGPISRALPLGEERERFGFSWLDADAMASVDGPGESFTWTAYDDAPAPADDLQERGDGLLSNVAEGEESDATPVWLAVDGDEAVVARSEDGAHVSAWLDGETGSLAEEEPLAAVAEALDDEDVLAAYLVSPQGDQAPTVGVGWSVDRGESGFAVVYDLGDDAAARDAVGGLRDDYAGQGLAEQLEVNEVEAEGRVVVVRGAPAEGRVETVLRLLLNFGLPTVP